MIDKTNDLRQTVSSLGSGLPETSETALPNDRSEEEIRQQYALLLQRYEKLQQQYCLLANSKAGRVTLRYWEFKDRLKESMDIFRREGFRLRLKRLPLSPSAWPSISVIIPTYCETPLLDEAVQSVLAQDYPKEKVRILLAVNGADRAYFERLENRYGGVERIKVLYTEKQGAAAARNLAMAEADTECVFYLDDDDWITKGYLRSMAVRMYPDVTFVCAPLCDNDPETGEYSRETYINKALLSAGSGLHNRYSVLAPLLSSMPAKLYRTAMLKEDLRPMDEQIRSSEDVIFWAENYAALRGYAYLCKGNSNECYMRRMTSGSLSRPTSNDWRIYILDRLAALERLEILLDRAVSDEERQFIAGKASAQKNMLEQYAMTLEEMCRCEAEKMIRESLVKRKGIE